MPVPVPRRPVSRRTAVMGGAAVVAVAVAGTLVVALNGGSRTKPPAPLMTPVAERDTVPKPRAYKQDDVPESCGVGAATTRKYVPGYHHVNGPNCDWYSSTSIRRRDCFDICPVPDRDGERRLHVRLEMTEPKDAGTGSAAGSALRTISSTRLSQLAAGRLPRAVTGLGDDADYSYSAANKTHRDGGGRLTFRAGNAVVRIDYAGRDRNPKGRLTQMPDAEAREAVFAAATDVAKRLGVQAAPAFGDLALPSRKPPVRRAPPPCDLLPASLARRLTPGARPQRPDPRVQGGFTGTDERVAGATEQGCTWNIPAITDSGRGDRPGQRLTVTVRSLRDRRPGIGTWLARHDFLAAYHDAREGPERAQFQRVRGLGDEAYSSVIDAKDRRAGGGPYQIGAEVAFRYRNVAIMVDYLRLANNPGPPAYAVNAAYTVAARARATLPA